MFISYRRSFKLDHVGARNSGIALGSPFAGSGHGRDKSSAQEGEYRKEWKHGRTVRVTRDKRIGEEDNQETCLSGYLPEAGLNMLAISRTLLLLYMVKTTCMHSLTSQRYGSRLISSSACGGGCRAHPTTVQRGSIRCTIGGLGCLIWVRQFDAGCHLGGQSRR